MPPMHCTFAINTLVARCLLLLALAFAPIAAAQPAGESGLGLEAAIAELATARLSQMPKVVVALEEAGGEEVVPLLRALMAGELYLRETDATIVRAVTVPAGDYAVSDALTGEPLGAAPETELRKIKTSNRVRSLLRTAIARLTLSSAKPEVRRVAAQELLDELDADNHSLLERARAGESDDEVAELLDISLALITLQTEQDSAARLAAVSTLGTSLQSSVRNKLRLMLAENAGEDPAVRAAAAKALARIESRVAFYAKLETVFFGLSLGSVLLLAAIGLAITFGVMGVINMAHGELIMLGAYTTYVIQLLLPNHIEYSLLIAVPAAFLVSGLVGVLIERSVIRHLHGRPLETLLATFGISLILQQAVRSVFSPLNRQVFTPDWMSGSLEINAVFSLTYNRLYVLLFALLVFMLLRLVLSRTSLGLQVRAVAQNRNMAKAVGVRADRVDALTFGLGSGIAGVAGVALSQLTNVGPNLGQAYIIDSFLVVVFGGVGNLWGTLVGAMTLGVGNKFLEPSTGAVLAKILVLVFIILFIQKRPRGLFPQKGRAAE